MAAVSLFATLSVVCASPVRAQTIVGGDAGGAYQTSDSGSAQYQIPLPVPPGVNGQQPRLSLAYDSGGGNSLLGVGWRLSGLSSITRCAASVAVDGFRGTVAYDARDRYCADGQRLIVVSGEYGAPGSTYRTELETWRLFVASADMCGSGPCSFTVSLRDGSTSRYGVTDQSRVLALSEEGTPRKDVRVWAIDDVTDTNGNRLSFTYSLAPQGTAAVPGDGQSYLTEIRYGANIRAGTDHNRRIAFVWEDREDAFLHYVGGGGVRTRARLAAVRTSVDATNGPLVAHDYRIGYRTSETSGRSLVESIQTCSAPGGETVCLQPERFAWQGDRAIAFTASRIGEGVQVPAGARSFQPGDLNADGRGDLIHTRLTDAGYAVLPLLSTGSSLEACPQTLTVPSQQDDRLTFADTNGDGALDAVHLLQAGGYARIDVFYGRPGTCEFDGRASVQTDIPGLPALVWPTDADGDGKVDIVFGAKAGSQIEITAYFGTADGLRRQAGPTLSIPSGQGQQFFPLDVNGDGQVDLVNSYLAGTSLFLQSLLAGEEGFVAGPTGSFGKPANLLGLWPMDANGDGMGDIVQGWLAGGTQLNLTILHASGTGEFLAGPTTDTGTGAGNALAFWPMDVIGDGSIDLVQIAANSSGVDLWVYQNRAGRFAPGVRVATGLNAAKVSTIWPLDLTGNGKTDLVQAWAPAGTYEFYGFFNQGPRPDYVAAFENALGGVSEIAYRPLSDPAVFSRETVTVAQNLEPADAGAVVSTLGYVYRGTPSQGPFQKMGGSSKLVVAEVRERNAANSAGAAYADLTRYFYRGGLYDLAEGRGWLGFASVETTDVDAGLKHTKALNQLFPLTGTVRSIVTACLADLSSDPLCSGEETELTGVETRYEARPLVRGTAPSGRDPSQRQAIWEVVKASDRSDYYTYGAYEFSLGQRYEYNEWGSETKTTDLGRVTRGGENLSDADDVATCTAYRDTAGATAWALGYPVSRKVSQAPSCDDYATFSAADLSLERWTYDGRWNTASYGLYDATNAVDLTTTFAFDDFGNTISTTLPGGRTTEVAYDAVYHAFPARQTVPPNEAGLRLVEYFAYDPRYDRAIAHQALSDPDPAGSQGAVSVQCLDALGRVAAIQASAPGTPATVATQANCLRSTNLTGDRGSAFRDAPVVALARMAHLAPDGDAARMQSERLQSWPTADTAGIFQTTLAYYDGKRRNYMMLTEAGPLTPVPGGWVAQCTRYDSRNQDLATLVPAYGTDVPGCTPEGELVGPQVRNTYDAYGRQTRHEVPLSQDRASVTEFAFPDQLTMRTVRGAGSEDPYVRSFAYDYFTGDREIVSITVPEDGDAQTLFGYDRIGRLVSVRSPIDPASGNVVLNTIGYDSAGRRSFQDNPDQNSSGDPDRRALALAYDPQTGLLQRATDAAGRTTLYRYDARARLTGKTFHDGTAVRFAYDATGPETPNGLGRQTSETGLAADGRPLYARSFGYAATGQPTRLTMRYGDEASGYTLASEFDPEGRLLTRTYPGGRTYRLTYALDALERVEGEGVAARFGDYTVRGQPKLHDYGALSGRREYDAMGNLVERSVAGADGATVLDLALDWNEQILLRGIKDLRAPGEGLSQSFDYTHRRLTRAHAPGLYGTRSFGYDQLGNLTRTQDGEIGYRWHRPMEGRLGDGRDYRVEYSDTGNALRRQLGEEVWDFAYDGRDRIGAVSRNGVRQLEIPAYTEDGQRIARRTADGTEVRYVASDYQVSIPAEGVPLHTAYLSGPLGIMAAVTYSDGATTGIAETDLPAPGTLYFDTDHLNSTSLVFDADGTLRSQRSYLPYGMVADGGTSGPGGFRPLYQGREYDDGSNLYYFGTRYYDPLVGRFLTADRGTGGQLYGQDTLNRFAFGMNAPTTYTDPTGQSIWDSIAGAVIGTAEIVAGVAIDVLTDGAAESVGGALIGAGFNGITYSVTNSSNFSWKQYGVQEAEGAVIGFVTAGIGEILAPATEIASDLAADAIESATSSIAEDVTADALEDIGGDSLDAAADSSTASGEGSGAEALGAGEDGAEGGAFEEGEMCSASFPAGVQVILPDGTASIETLVANVLVLSRNSLDRSDADIAIEAVLSRPEAQIIRLHLEDAGGATSVLRLTPNHPVHIDGIGWRPAAQVRAGDRLETARGEPVLVAGLEPETEPTTVYNFLVPGYQSYFVGDFGVWVHNPCGKRAFTQQEIQQNGLTSQYEITISKSDYPEAAQHIEDWEKANNEYEFTIDRGGANANRRASLKGIKTMKGFDRDEFPMAMFQEGGQGASVRYMTPWDNRGAGSSIGAALREFPDGVRIFLRVVN